ncbi:universal stress protein [Streptomyces sp. NPDC091416]|uniref:universal stress protein n=1 Tax=Streptomyces sp. NPDC091416 TaxID=3366003 RepID=UPI00382D55B8
MDKPVTVGVDGSPSSMKALDWAADEAALHSRPLRIVHASVWERFEGATPAEDFPEGLTEAAALEEIITAAETRARGRRPEVRVRAELLPGEPVDVLVHAGEDAFALVIGHRGHQGLLRHLSTGSVVSGVAERAWCPIVVVGDCAPRPPSEARHVILGVGEGTDAGAAQVSFALHEAQARGGDLVVVHSLSRQETHQGSPDLGSRAADALLSTAVPDRTAAECGVTVRRQVVDGPAHRALTRAAHVADLLVLGVRHRHGMVRRELGPTHHAALRHSPCPVALVSTPWPPP